MTEEYRELADYLHLAEWTPVVWIGRLFSMDNDVGEHWFDNWDLREERAAKAEALGIPEEELLIIDPDRFQDGRDGPCHDALQRKRFWTDVLRSLELSYETLFDEARKANPTSTVRPRKVGKKGRNGGSGIRKLLILLEGARWSGVCSDENAVFGTLL